MLHCCKTFCAWHFSPYGHVGVGVNGGLEAPVHGIRKPTTDKSQNDDFCCVKVDMKNAFNECRRKPFLDSVRKNFPEFFAGVQWSYHCAAELRFGIHCLTSTAACSSFQVLKHSSGTLTIVLSLVQETLFPSYSNLLLTKDSVLEFTSISRLSWHQFWISPGKCHHLWIRIVWVSNCWIWSFVWRVLQITCLWEASERWGTEVPDPAFSDV